MRGVALGNVLESQSFIHRGKISPIVLRGTAKQCDAPRANYFSKVAANMSSPVTRQMPSGTWTPCSTSGRTSTYFASFGTVGGRSRVSSALANWRTSFAVKGLSDHLTSPRSPSSPSMLEDTMSHSGRFSCHHRCAGNHSCPEDTRPVTAGHLWMFLHASSSH